MDDSCILFFTSRTAERMIAERGCQAWDLDVRRAREFHYLVCAWNANGRLAPRTHYRAHREAFFIAPITRIEPSSDSPGRQIVRFSEFAYLNNYPETWNKQRWPVSYTTLGALGIDPDKVLFEKIQALAKGSA